MRFVAIRILFPKLCCTKLICLLSIFYIKCAQTINYNILMKFKLCILNHHYVDNKNHIFNSSLITAMRIIIEDFNFESY